MNLEKVFKDLNCDPLRFLEMLMFSDSSSVIVFKNTKSEILYVNDNFYRKHPEFKANKESVYGKTDFDLFPNSLSHAKQAFEDEQEVLKTGKAINLLETEGKDSFGNVKYAHTKKYPIYDNNNQPIGIFVMTEDITNDMETMIENQERSAMLTKLNQTLTHENTTDTLSKLHNRRFFDLELQALLQKETPFSVILLDLDNFKRINDNFGHPVGDKVISFVGEGLLKIKQERYPSIEACRYGGDEFFIITPHALKEEAVEIAHEIHDYFANTPLNYGTFKENIQFSIGIASIEEGDEIHNLLKRCDQFLYLAKKSGKNQIQY